MAKKTMKFIALVIVFSVASFFVSRQAVHAARCFQDVRYPSSTGTGWDTDSTFISQAPGCSVEMGPAGYDISGLPNPFPASDGVCYYFPDSGGNQTVDCNDPRFANAPEYGKQPDGSTNTIDKEPLRDTKTGGVNAGAGDELNNWLNSAINVLSALVGLVIVGSIIFAGIQYQTARDNASQVSAAKNRIAMAVLSLFLYFFAYAILQWLVPGGIF